MTAEQKEKIISLRRENYGYSAIANRLGLSKDSVKAFCRSHGLAGIKACTVETPVITTNTCLNCGALLCQTANGTDIGPRGIIHDFFHGFGVRIRHGRVYHCSHYRNAKRIDNHGILGYQ